MGRFNHSFDRLGDAVGMSEEKQKAILDCFNQALDDLDKHPDTSKSRILERTLQLIRQQGIANDEHEHFFAAFFLSEFISKNIINKQIEETTEFTIKAIATTFKKQLKDKGIELKDLPLEDMIKETQENMADMQDVVGQVLNAKPSEMIDEKKLLAHIESDKNDF